MMYCYHPGIYYGQYSEICSINHGINLYEILQTGLQQKRSCQIKPELEPERVKKLNEIKLLRFRLCTFELFNAFYDKHKGALKI